MPAPPPCAFTVDLEEWFCSHTEEVPEIGGFERWPAYEQRAHRIVPQLLDRLAAAGVRATFFVLGWYAERNPDVVRRVHAAGHTVGCHTYAHRNLFHFDVEGLRADLRRAKGILEDITGAPVTSFRAPNFSVKRENLWALRVLAEEGFRYDSSVFPALRFDGGIPGFPPGPAVVEIEGQRLYELPLSVLPVAGKMLPIFGGGYYRLAPDALVRLGTEVLQRRGQPVVFYFHPYDFDWEAPVFPYTPLGRFRRYVRRRGLLGRVSDLLSARRFAPMEEYLEGLQYETAPRTFDGLLVYPAKA